MTNSPLSGAFSLIDGSYFPQRNTRERRPPSSRTQPSKGYRLQHQPDRQFTPPSRPPCPFPAPTPHSPFSFLLSPFSIPLFPFPFPLFPFPFFLSPFSIPLSPFPFFL